MNIEHYTFGEITIDGRRYDSDVLIYPDGTVDDSWWRREGHKLSLADIRQLLKSEPDVIVAGTGANGMMRPDADLERGLKNAGIAFKAAPTDQAIQLLVRARAGSKVAACLHLTC